MRTYAPLIALAAALEAAPARAHHAMDNALPANLFEGFLSGLAHPVIGLDHLLFVLAIGAACWFFGRRAGTVAVFVAGTLAGTIVHLYRASLTYPDAWVAGSLVLLGVLFVRGKPVLRSRAAPAILALAGLAHGYAYGESIVGAEATPLVAYLAGFTLIQLAIASAGFAIARRCTRAAPERRAADVAGGALSLAGAAFLALALW